MNTAMTKVNDEGLNERRGEDRRCWGEGFNDFKRNGNEKVDLGGKKENE